ncbi:MAG: YhcH/YjgK/YiaL family protein [Planctomycetota bacterium]|nr:YhcH/YjgK/YiaL family protein [Planctomycetota bacterium]
MIYFDIQHFRRSAGTCRPIGKALEFISEKAHGLADGTHDLGNGMFAILKKYEPAAREKRRYESHVRMVDIQVVLDGAEIIYCCRSLPEGTKVTEDRLARDDVCFYEGLSLPGEFPLAMLPGLAAILTPADYHQTECFAGIKTCRKALIKIPVELMEI